MLNHHPASEASRELANLTERKNSHNPVWLGLYFLPFLQCAPSKKIVKWGLTKEYFMNEKNET